MNIQTDTHFTAVIHHQREALERAERERRMRRALGSTPAPGRLTRLLHRARDLRRAPAPRPA